MMLLELMVALVISATVVLLAYATLRGGLDTEARVLAAREQVSVHAVLRTLLSDGLRHGAGIVVGGVDAAAPELRFATRGLNAVQGAGDALQVRLHVDSGAVVLDADAIDGSRLPLRLRDSSVHGFTTRYRAIGDDAWRDRWDDSTRLPDAVELRWQDRGGRPAGVPLVVRPFAGGR